MPETTAEALLENTHPGQMLRKDFLLPLGITPGTLAVSLGLSRTHVSKLLHGQRKITPLTSLLLGKFYGWNKLFLSRVQLRSSCSGRVNNPPLFRFREKTVSTMTQKALMISICQLDQDYELLGNTDSIKDLSPDVRERVVGAYVKHEANGEVPEYQGKAEKLHDPKHHAYIHLCNCLRRGWLK